MTTADAERYTDLSAEYLRKARLHLAEEDLTQASEKGWGAAAVAVKAVAEARGLRHGGHRDLFIVVRRLVDETGDAELGNQFREASALHTNFYENWFPKADVAEGLAHVERFVARLRDLN